MLDLEWPYKRHAGVFAGTQRYAEEQGWKSIVDEYAYDEIMLHEDLDRCEFHNLLRCSGCIARCGIVLVTTRSGEIHRPQFRPVNCVVQLMASRSLLAVCEGLRF
jgi:hypothetical protein